MDTKRVLISTALGLLFGGICTYGSVDHIPSELPMVPILASIFYNRVLLGFVIGIADGIEISPALRGAVLGLIVSAAIAIPTGVVESAAVIIAAGIVYGIIIDVVATKAS
ncbi:MAG: hypothetical protein U9N48_05855 [Euryarchaeota archaeon]|nr:hypothetical protein [Euryarchaeota archaeon]